ncbi:MAG: response regulator [Burkholderiaceae bacterium]|nr:response regulator [Burkholderiaceae bacterium]
MKQQIMIVDDEVNILNAMKRLISYSMKSDDGQAPVVEVFSEPHLALRRLEEMHFGVIISDYKMPGMSGVEFLAAAREIQPDSFRMILSGYADLNAIVAAVNVAGIQRFAAKPWVDHELISAISEGLKIYELSMENRALLNELQLAKGGASPHDAELKRFELQEPALTRINFAPDGSIIMDDL